MKILSKFKDYYDYLVHQYGEDPSIILDRRDIPVENGNVKSLSSLGVDRLPLKLPERKQGLRAGDNSFVNVEYFVIVIMGVPYLVEKLTEYRTDKKHLVVSSKTNSKWIKRAEDTYDHPEIKKLNPKIYNLAWHNAHLTQQTVPELIKISKAVNRAVYKLDSGVGQFGFGIGVYRESPCLTAEKCCPLTPQEMYQQLSYYIGNVLRDSPDKQPPVQVSDKDRILQHGFDLKQSFRHRK